MDFVLPNLQPPGYDLVLMNDIMAVKFDVTG